jgi:hypothetical protein
MTKRTQRFVFLGVTILVVGLGTGLVASYVGFPNLGLVGSDGPVELAYVPADATVVAYADVREVMDSELRQKLLKFSPGNDASADWFQTETGINIQTDVDRVVASMPTPNTGNPPRPLVLIRGRFDTSRIESLIREKGGTVTDYNKQRVISVNNEFGLAFVEPGLAAVGDLASVKRAIDTKLSGSNVTSNAAIMRLVRDLDAGNAWAVADVQSVTNASLLPPEVKQQLPPVTWFAVSGRVSDGLEAVIRAEARDEAAANNLRDVVRGFIALARMQAGQHPALADLVNSVELGGTGTTVSIAVSIPASMIDLLGAIRANQGRPTEQVPGAAAPRRKLPTTL